MICGHAKIAKKSIKHCKYKQNIYFCDSMLQNHCKYQPKLTCMLQNHCKYKQKWNACSRTIANTSKYERHVHNIIVNTSTNWATFQKAVFLQYKINLNPAGRPGRQAGPGMRLILYCKNNAFWKVAQFVLVFAMRYEHAFHICLYLQWFLSVRFIFACIYNGSGEGVSAFACIYNEFEAWNQRNQYFACIYNGLVAF